MKVAQTLLGVAAILLRGIGLIAYGTTGFGLTVLALGLFDALTGGKPFANEGTVVGVTIFAGLTIGIPLIVGYACRGAARAIRTRINQVDQA